MDRNEKEHAKIFQKLTELETNLKWSLALNVGIFLAVVGVFVKGGFSG